MDQVNVIKYFDLRADNAVFGGGTIVVRELSLYLGSLLGAISKVIYDLLETGALAVSAEFALAAIGSTVSFPYIYRKANLNLGKLSPVKFFVAFQHGFFWSLVIATVAEKV